MMDKDIVTHTSAMEKSQLAHLESRTSNVKEAHHVVQMKSELDDMGWWETLVTFKRVVLVAGIAGFTAATDGYQNQLNGSIVSNKGFIRQFSGGGTKLDPSHVSAFGGCASAGMIVGQFSIQFVNERFGRKIAMWTMLFGLLLSVIVETVGTLWWHWVIAKLIAGAAIGSVQATLPVYINEQSVPRIRGLFIVAYTLWITVGNLLASIALQVRGESHPYDYKTPIYTQYGMIGLCALIFVFLPESPWWLMSKGKRDQCRKVLEWKFKGVADADVDKELMVMEETIAEQRRWDEIYKSQGIFAIFKGLNLKRFLIGSWPKVLQQFIGMSVFSNYSTYFFQIAGNPNPFLATIYLTVVSLLSCVLDALLVDRIGRRRMTLIGFGGACSGVLLLAIIGCFDYTKPSLGTVLVVACCIANFCNTFQSSTSYAYLTEMPEQRFRARATGWGLAWCNCFSVLFSFTVPLMLNKWVVKTAFLFVCTGVPGTILAYFIMPESAGRSPAEIDEMFNDKINIRKWRGYKTQVEKDLEVIQHGQVGSA